MLLLNTKSMRIDLRCTADLELKDESNGKTFSSGEFPKRYCTKYSSTKMREVDAKASGSHPERGQGK
jgi:hypothetical protein